MTRYPQEYSKNTYVSWHNTVVEPEQDLIAGLSKIIEELKHAEKDRLKKLAVLLDRISTFQRAAAKSKGDDISDLKVEIHLSDALATSDKYNFLFKSMDSLIDKLWRKNKGRKPGEYITTQNIKKEIGDLVRSSIITSTFAYAKHLTTAIGMWEEQIKLMNLNREDYNIDTIECQEEAKMANGYFAYHIDVRYTDGLRVEIQVYSKLTEVWHHLSHKLYEKSRLGENAPLGHGTIASRLVSLGHLLHLAECEIEHLKDKM